MAIYGFLEGGSFGPDEIKRLAEAYECALRELRLADRTDPVTELVAKKIIELGRADGCDPAQLCGKALKALGMPSAA